MTLRSNHVFLNKRCKQRNKSDLIAKDKNNCFVKQTQCTKCILSGTKKKKKNSFKYGYGLWQMDALIQIFPHGSVFPNDVEKRIGQWP